MVHNVIHHVNCHRHQLWLKNNTRLIVTTYIIIFAVFAMSCSYINRKTLWSLSLTSGVHLTCAIIRKSSMVFELQKLLPFEDSGTQISDIYVLCDSIDCLTKIYHPLCWDMSTLSSMVKYPALASFIPNARPFQTTFGQTAFDKKVSLPLTRKLKPKCQEKSCFLAVILGLVGKYFWMRQYSILKLYDIPYYMYYS